MRSAAHARRLRQVLRRAAGLTVPMLLPGGLPLPAGVPARPQIKGSAGLAYSAAGLPPGLVISPAGLITALAGRLAPAPSRSPRRRPRGATAVTTFAWTISPSGS
jgi:hypothetical protein